MSESPHPPQGEATGAWPAQVALQYEQLAGGETLPDVHSFLAGFAELPAGVVLDVLRADQELRWRRGNPVPAEDYLQRQPLVRDDPEAALRLVYGEFLIRRQLGQRPSVEEYLARFPQLGDALRRQLELELALASGDTPPTPDTRDPWWVSEAGAAPPGQLGSFRLLELLGEGGMGQVYRAEDTRLRRVVAIKVMRPGLAGRTEVRARFLREARAAAALQHDHVVAVYEVGEDRGVAYLVMPLLAGESLQRRLCREPMLPPAEVIRIGREAAEGLAAAHEKGLVHRDVKPANLWLEAPSGRVKILDFGLARGAGDEALTGTGAILGSPGYMAPEQAGAGVVDARTDLFGLGCVLYRAATGQAPFGGPTLTVLVRAVTQRQPEPPHIVNPAVPLPLSELIMRLLAKAADGRPTSAAEVARALHELQQPGQAPDVDLNSPPRFSPDRKASEPMPVRHRRAVWALVGVLVLAVVGGSLFLLPSLGPSRKPDSGQADGETAGKPPEPVKVLRLDVRHYVRNGEFEDYKARLGVAGGSFSTRLDDSVTVEGKLSRPAYCYLIGYRPDGKEDLWFPEDVAKPPPLTDEPRFPLKAGGDHCALEEGEGLMAFVLVASPEPLPAFVEWRRSRGVSPWRPTRAAPGVVWLGDDVTLRPATADDSEARGPRRAATGVKPLIELLLKWLRQDKRFEAVQAVAFPVLPKP